MCERPARGLRGPARCEEHFSAKRRIPDCVECGANRTDDAPRRRAPGLCVDCASTCRVCGGPRSQLAAGRNRLCDEHLRETQRKARKRKPCRFCGAESDGKNGWAMCADCRACCRRCGAKSSDGRCRICKADYNRKRYRVQMGIPLDARSGGECEECGSDFGPAENHRTVTVIRRYCSDACRNRAKCRRRRVARAGGLVEKYAAADVFRRDGWQCRICSKSVPREARWPDSMSATIDHIFPVSLGGADILSNVQTAHLSCNIRKGNRVGV